MNEETDKAFKEFVVKKCSALINSKEYAFTKEQIEVMIFAYGQGFMDALEILKAESVIEIQAYI